ncbi:MAG: hypothetical protein NFCOHLIN_00717 [Gammaproteobacteria bacterium]|nr:hypothetical protein [Gammaproteobacteria bacterium]
MFVTSLAVAATVERGARPFEDCLGVALEHKAGRVIKVEFKTVDARKAYEFDIMDSDGKAWDVECDADAATIVSVEREVDSVADPLFAAQAKISESQARRILTQQYPGEIEEVEYEIEESGSASYEFDIAAGDGTQTKVEIDAATGEIIEADHELWQVGFE